MPVTLLNETPSYDTAVLLLPEGRAAPRVQTADDQDAAQEEWDTLLDQLFESALELGNHNSRELLNIVEFLQ